MSPHNRASKDEIAKNILMPGDPLRAKFAAEGFLENARLVTDVRNMLGYTGYYHGVPVTVMASGMGGASAGIYSYELFKLYDADRIIRIGTAGGLKKELKVGELIFPLTASTDSGWAHQYDLKGTFSPAPDFETLEVAIESANSLRLDYSAGMVFSSDCFSQYNALGPDSWKSWARMGAIAQDMETYALYSNAMYLNKKALSILTMTDNLVTGESFNDEDRMNGNSNMIKAALETIRRLNDKDN